MLPTASRAAPRAARRALTTAAANRAPLAPPYQHSLGARPALAPPYTHPLAHVPEPTREQRLKAPYAFSLLRESTVSEPQGQTPQEWAAELLSTPAGREWAEASWTAALAELSEQASTPPEIAFQALSAVLADGAVCKSVLRAGGVVVRDVVRDGVAESWATELSEAMTQRFEQPTFHHAVQVTARADPSVLSATGAVLRALLPAASPESAYIRVDSAASVPSPSSWAGKNLWEIDVSATPFTPLHAHLALAHTELAVPTSSAAATYALLRPFFTPKASRISFYSPKQYLDASNWTLRTGAPEFDAELVHVRPASVSLAPGDVLVTHAGLRLSTSNDSGLVLPVHPLPATEGNKAYVALQRAAFEAGLPPPHVDLAGAPIALEEGGDASLIESWGGRRAMGYGF